MRVGVVGMDDRARRGAQPAAQATQRGEIEAAALAAGLDFDALRFQFASERTGLEQADHPAAMSGRALHAGQIDDHAFEASAFEVFDHVNDIERRLVRTVAHAGSSQTVTRRLPLAVSAIASTVSNSMRTPSPVSLWMPARIRSCTAGS